MVAGRPTFSPFAGSANFFSGAPAVILSLLIAAGWRLRLSGYVPKNLKEIREIIRIRKMDCYNKTESNLPTQLTDRLYHQMIFVIKRRLVLLPSHAFVTCPSDGCQLCIL